jgi:nucleoside-diphosphate-sugar epimerase
MIQADEANAMSRTLFLLGGTGFIGREVVQEAVAAGYTVRGLARSDDSAAVLAAAGAEPVRGDAARPAQWATQLRGVDVLIDLVQPPLPKRLGASAVASIVRDRVAFSEALGRELMSIPPAERPVWFSISGADDLEPQDGVISHESPHRREPKGFARIGVPILRAVQGSGADVAYVYLGVMVYGPGKAFAEYFVNALKKGRARVIGKGENRLPIVHVTDAARALVQLAGLPREQLVGHSFLAADGADATGRELLAETARLMGRKPPGSAPVWLVALIAGRTAAEAMTFDAHVDNSALRATGFEYRYPSYREGVRQTLADLGELA